MKLSDKLALLGRQGWELVGFEDTTEYSEAVGPIASWQQRTMVLKRPAT